MSILEEGATELERFYAYDGHIFTALDCLSGKPLNPDVVHDVITQTPYYAQGIARLTPQKHLQCNVWLGAHRLASDLGPEGSFEQALRDTDIYVPKGLLADQKVAADDSVIQDLARAYAEPQYRSFELRQLRALNTSGVLVRLLDMTSD